jgi:uncharacterized membrane protein
MFVLLLLIATLALWWLFARVSALESTIAGLTARVKLLERSGASATAPAPIARPAPVTAVQEERVRIEAGPKGPAPRRPGPFGPGDLIGNLSSQNPDSLEARIGSRWLLYLGVMAIVVGVSYFEKLAFENQWIGETARIIQGAIAGVALIGVGLRFVRAGYRLYGQVLSGCGIAILYVTMYAAFNLYHLISRPAAFALMSLVTAIAASLADKQRSQSLAIVAVGGGFATPFLLPSAVDAHVALFTYEAILIAGTMFLARRREWPALNIVSYSLNVLTMSAWAANFYDPAKYFSTELFITLYCAMFLFILRQGHHPSHRTDASAKDVLWTAPLVYYFASLAILTAHSPALLVYLMILSLVGVVASARAASWIRLPFWIAAAWPLLFWSHAYESRLWPTFGLAAWAVVYLLNLSGLLKKTLEREPVLGGVEIAVLHLNGLIPFLGAYLLIEPVRAAATAPLALAFAAWHGLLAAVIFNRRRELALHFAAVAFTLLTVSIGLQFKGPWLTSAWAAEGAVVVCLGLRERSEWLRAGGLVLFAVAIVRTLNGWLFSTLNPYAYVLFNPRALTGLFVIALAYVLALAHHRGGRHISHVDMNQAALISAANLVTLALLTSEITAYWNGRVTSTERHLAKEMTLSIAWAVYATVLVVAGLRKRYPPIRYFAIALFVITAIKVFAVDLGELDRIYRVLSVIGLGIMLLASSYMYQRFVSSSSVHR